MTAPKWPGYFLLKRLHSLSGLFITLYLIEHLFVNSQAALINIEPDLGFITAVNSIHSLPFLLFIEVTLLGVPILTHALLGIMYLKSGENNVFDRSLNKPYLPEYGRNWAYTFQRITSWILLFGIVAHVIQMRFIDYPLISHDGLEHSYVVRLTGDQGLESLADRLDVQLYTAAQVKELQHAPSWVVALQDRPLTNSELVAVASNFGTAELLIVRETFKMPIMLVLYTIFVLAACFHGFNGLWTFLISWGVTLTARSQQVTLWMAQFLMILIAFLGLAAIWGVS